MINHVRTLILNRSGSPTGFLRRPGEEFIPPDYRKLENLPNHVAAPRRVLLGVQSDWLFENYRIRQLMALLHQTELASLVMEPDSRVTYDPANPEFFSGIFGTTADRTGIRFIGDPPLPDASGVSLRRWRITVLDSETVRIVPLIPNGSASDVTYTADNSWSDLVPLGSNMFYISFEPTIGKTWTVEQKLRPQRSLGELLVDLEHSTGAYWNDLFNQTSSSEPWPTLRNLWHSQESLPYRLGAFLLALAYSTDRRRTGNG